MGLEFGNQSGDRRNENACPWHSCTGQHSEPLAPETHADQGVGGVIRRTIIFQIRLAADGLRDLLLSPICIIAALLGLFNPRNPGWALDILMAMGRRSDRWINLFEQESLHPTPRREPTLDDLCDVIEEEVKGQMKSTEWQEKYQSWQQDFADFAHSHQRSAK